MIRRFYYIIHNGDILPVKAANLNLGHMPLLWMNKGLYGLIRQEKIANMIDLLDIANQHALNPNIKAGIFHWDEVEIIDARIGRILMGEADQRDFAIGRN